MTALKLKSIKQTGPKPPPCLSQPAGKWWSKLVAEYQIADAAGLMLLEVAMVAWDRLQQAQAMIARDGPVVTVGGRQIAHPAVVLERDSAARFLAAMKSLNLDIEPLRDTIGRPPGLSKAHRGY